MTFAQGKLAIFGGVNRLTGSYALLDDRVVMGELVSTRMAGPSVLVELVRDFAKSLAQVDSFHAHENQLTLLRGGENVATFQVEE